MGNIKYIVLPKQLIAKLLKVTLNGIGSRCFLLKKTLAGFALLFMLVSNMVIADSSKQKTHNLVSLFSAALTYDAVYQKSLHEKGATEEEVVQANARFYPAVSFSAERNFINEESNRTTNLFGQGDDQGYNTVDYISENVSLSVVQPLYRSDSIAGLLQAQARDRGSELSVVSAKQDLMLRVIERYLTVLAAQDATEFSLKEELAVEQQYNLANARLKAQLGTEADLLDAKARYAVVRANTIAARNVLDDALQALIEITGEHVTNLGSLGKMQVSNPDPDSIESWVNAALFNNITIRQRQTSVEIAREEIRKQRSAHEPTLDAVLSKSRATSIRDGLGQNSNTNTSQVSLQLNMPIYFGGAINSRTRQASKLMDAANSELDQQRRAVAREVRAAFLGIKSALNRIDSLVQAVSAQSLVVKTRRAGFPRVYNSLDVLDAEKDLYSAKRDLARAKYDYLFSDARLSASVGALDEDELTAMNRQFVIW